MITYQRVMKIVFTNLIGLKLEVYIDDIVIKSNEFKMHLDDLKEAYERIKKWI